MSNKPKSTVTGVTLASLLASAVAVEQSFTQAKGDFDRALLAVAVQATDEYGFAFVKGAPGYSEDKVAEFREAVTKAFANKAADYQRKIYQRICDHQCDYILSENAPKKVAAIAAGLTDEVHGEAVKKADRTIAGQARLKAAKDATAAKAKLLPPKTKEEKAAERRAADTEMALSFITKAVKLVGDTDVFAPSNVTIAICKALVDAKEMLEPAKG